MQMQIKSSWNKKKIDKFVIINSMIGQGNYGSVYRGFFQEDESKLIAAKLTPISDIQSSNKMLDLIRREIQILQQIKNHTNIVRLWEVARTPSNLYLFFEYCEDGDLKQYLDKRQNQQNQRYLSENEACIFFRHICEGFKELFANNIMHRDIKPANVLLHRGQAKISDFGFARVVEECDGPKYWSRLGTPLYMAPQILKGDPFSLKCDVWSVGILFFEMLYGKTPYIGDNQVKLYNNILNNQLVFPETPIRSQRVKDLIRKMLQINESDRICWEEIFKSPLLTDMNMIYDEKFLNNNNNDGSQDKMSLNINENQMYIQQNLVAGYLQQNSDDKNQAEGNNYNNFKKIQSQNEQQNDNNNQQQQFAESSEQSMDKSKFKDSSQLIKNQLDNQKLNRHIQKINEYILYERNIAFFFNYIIQKLIKSYNKNKLNILPDCYFRLIFSICKNQNIAIEKINSMVSNKTSTMFAPELWNNYLESQEYKLTSKRIEKDVYQSLKFFKELFKKTQDIIQQSLSVKPNDQKLLKFQQIVNSNIPTQPDQTFTDIYQSTLQEFLDFLIPLIKEKNTDKETLVLIEYIIVSSNPYKVFAGCFFDFNLFYEQIENIKEEELRQDLIQQLTLNPNSQQQSQLLTQQSKQQQVKKTI